MENGGYQKLLLSRPASQPTGTLYQDLGSGFDIPKSLKKRVAERAEDSDSGDELDSLGGRSDSAQVSVARPPKERRDTEDVIKGMRFKKNKQPSTDAEGQTPTSKENARRVAAKKSTGADRKNAVASSSSSTQPLRDKAPNRLQSLDGARDKRPREQRTGKDETTPKPRLKPRRKSSTLLVSSQSPSTPKPKAPTQEPAGSTNLKGKGKERVSSSAFPDLPPLSGGKGKGAADGAHEKAHSSSTFPVLSPFGDAKRKGKETELSQEASGIRKRKEKEKEKKPPRKAQRTYPAQSPPSSPAKRPFDDFLPSPLSTYEEKRNRAKLTGAEFPAPSPLRSKQQRKDARPFPMDLEGSTSKRPSPCSDSDDERERKRSKNMLEESYDYEEDSELLFISPGTDPKTLCPYCDTPLPPEPTPLLKRLLDQTYNKSYRDARPSNPLGRKAPMGVFVAVCQRHRFESETLPEAKARGWPKSIKWTALKRRVMEMKCDLSEILEDRGDRVVYGNHDAQEQHASESKRSKGPRMRCIFWKDLLKDVKNTGTKGVKGMQGQFANFEKTQPGYYGELGSMIIHQTLYDMFPLDTIDPELVDPLTPNEFIQRILVPEVGMRLVIQDMRLNVDDRADRKQAVAVLRESASYGVAMFPEDGGDWAGASGKKKDADDEDVMGVADQMVMERARKRRKELEIEEAEEDEMWRMQQEKEEEEAEKKRQKAELAKEKRRARRTAKEKDTKITVISQATIPRPRPRPVPKMKAIPVSKANSASGMDTDSSAPPRQNDSDVDLMDLTTSQSSAVKETHKPQSFDLSDSDSSDDVLMVSAVPRRKTKSRSATTTSAFSDVDRRESESDASRVKSTRPRSPPLTGDDGRQSARASSVVDLCSSSEDGGPTIGSSKSKSKSRKSPLQPVVALRKKALKLPDSSDEEQGEATPRAKRNRSQTHGAGAASSTFFPLDAARRRAPAKGERSTTSKALGWMHSMAEDVSDDGESSCASSQKSHSWLLDDVSQ